MSAALWVGELAGMTLTVEIAFGADLTDVDGSGWSWTDVTADVRQDPGISTALGRNDESARSNPATLTLTLDNSTSAYSLGGHGSHWPYVRRGTPVRVQVDPDDGDADRVVFLGFADGWTPTWRDGVRAGIPEVQLTASGTLQRLRQGQAPLASAYRRSVTEDTNTVAYWPMEEAQGAQYAPAVRGGQQMTLTEPASVRWASSDAFECSAPLPDVGGSGFVAVVDPYAATGESEASFFVIIPEDKLPDGTVLAYVYTTGTLGRFDIVYANGSTGNLSIFIYNQNGSLNTSTTNVGFDMDGNRRRLELQLVQNGSAVDWELSVVDANPGDPGGSISGTVSSRTFGTISQVFLAPGGGADGAIMGHLRVADQVSSTAGGNAPFWAWQRRSDLSTGYEFASSGTAAASRLGRLCTENGLQLTRFTGSNPSDGINIREGMGPQLVKTLLELIGECETADQGQVWDGRTPGLTITTRRYREDGNVALTIDAGAGELAGPFAPVDDDQRTRNKVTVSRLTGVSETFEDITGQMGTAVIGTYDTALEVNGASDLMVIQHAAFQVSLGTVAGYRYPTLTVDLRVAPELAGAVLDLVPGDVVRITNADDALTGFAPGDVDLMVEGIGHEIGARGWLTTLRCSWASPWVAGLVATETGDTGAYVARADTAGSTVNTTAPAGATSLVVATSTGPIWTTAADNFPLILDVGGVPVRATACSGSSSPQTFTVAPLELSRAAGLPVKLWDQRPLAL